MIEPIKSQPVLFSVEKVGRFAVAKITINRPEVLNSMNSECYRLIEAKLIEWATDDEIAAVVLAGAGEKSFCAGGDVKSLVIDGQKKGLDVAREFFTREYFVDSMIHNYSKPVIAFLDGITMGGGLGFSVGASHRIVTEKTLMAMPEISIGLFADVGATLFLKKLAGPFGVFMGLTGARIRASEAIQIGLADYFAPSNMKIKIAVDLLRLPWQGSPSIDREIVTEYLKVSLNNHMQIERERDFHIINDAFSQVKCLSDVEAFFVDGAKIESPFINETLNRAQAGSWLSRAVFFEATRRHELLTINETLQREWQLALSFSAEPEFYEGVRAVLIDKDQSPKWRIKSCSEAEKVDLNWYFDYCQRTGETNLLTKKIREHTKK